MIIHCKTYIYIYKSINKSSSRVDCRERWEANVDGEIIRSEEKSGEKQPVLLRAQWRRISLLRSLSASDDGAPASLLHWRSDPPSSRCSSQCVCVRARACVQKERQRCSDFAWFDLSSVPLRSLWGKPGAWSTFQHSGHRPRNLHVPAALMPGICPGCWTPVKRKRELGDYAEWGEVVHTRSLS